VTFRWWIAGGTFRAEAFLTGCGLPDGRLLGSETVEVRQFYPDMSATGLFLDFENMRTVSVAGLTMCAGQEVELGVTSAPLAPAVVDGAGSATSVVALEPGPWSPQVRGACVPGDEYAASRTPDGGFIDQIPPIALEVYLSRPDGNMSEKVVAASPGDTVGLGFVGLGPCVGDVARLGLFDETRSLLAWADVVVSGVGGASADLEVPASPGPLFPGVSGQCTAGHVYLGTDRVAIQQPEQPLPAPSPPSVPRPPATGSGADRDGGSPAWPLAGLAVALIVLGAGVAVRFR
jgi:hypothetical protein